MFETGRPWCEEALGMVLPDRGGMPVERFFKIDLEALYKAGGERHGVMAVVVDVTGHVRRVSRVYDWRAGSKRECERESCPS